MANTIELVVPDLGDVDEVAVIEILVSPGDAVEQEAGLITVESDKASMDIPAPEDGTVATLTVAVGDNVSSGDVIGTLSTSTAGGDTVAMKPPHAIQSELAEAEPEVTAAGGKQTLRVPNIGDFEGVEIIEVHVSAGDSIGVEDPIATLETDKAAMEVPAEAAGVVESVLIKVGDRVSEGAALVEIEAVAATPAETTVASETPAVESTSAAPNPAVQTPPKSAPPMTLPTINEVGFSRAHASPSVRKLARELGVDLVQVNGSGPKRRILHDDVKAFVKAALSGQLSSGGAALPQTPTVDFAKFGEIDEQPLTRIQKISGPRLQASWINLPHVTQHDLADITEMEQKRQQLKGPAKERGISLTPLAFVMKACVAALREFPKVNASLSEDGEHLVFKHYCHLGFAADTPQGLVVPVIRDCDKKDVYELAAELGELSALAREGKLKAAQMQGASFTISSLGGIGGTAFTPIVNAPEVAILGVSRSTMQPVWDGSEFQPRLMLPLSLSYDHRVIDGAQAVRFTTYLGQALADVDGMIEAIP